MITIQFVFCGIGLKKRWEFGDPRRSKIIVLELGLVKICKMRSDSKMVGFMRGYCDNDSFEWHPKVRLAKRKAEKKAMDYYYKEYKQQTNDWITRYEQVYRENSKLQDEKRSLLKVIELKSKENPSNAT